MSRIRGKKVTFKQYLEMGLKKETWGDSPESDFARDALRDSTFRDYEEWEGELLEAHIGLNGGCVEAVTAAKKLFQKWKAA
jgi:hypothetical protein